jgi:hypothetical protein
MSEQQDSDAIGKMLDSIKATTEVRNLVPLMGQRLLIQLAFPVPEFQRTPASWGPTGKFTNLFSGVIQPSPVADRVLIIMDNGTGCMPKATEVQATYLPLPVEEPSRIIV